jgi:hypothetical protein
LKNYLSTQLYVTPAVKLDEESNNVDPLHNGLLADADGVAGGFGSLIVNA